MLGEKSAEFFSPQLLKHFQKLPKERVSQDNGELAASNASRETVDALEKSSSHGMDAVQQKIPPRKGVTHGKSPYGH
jgi:hypothetical protein